MKTTLLAWPCLLLLTSCFEAPSGGRAVPGTVVREPLTAGTVRSQLHRAVGTPVLTSSAEANAARGLPTGYDDIPSVRESDDGRGPNTTVIHASHQLTACGGAVALATVAARIADCASKNGARAIWEAQASGNAGEGNWKLVLKASSQEIWLDQSTGLMWTDAVSRAANWCLASGNQEGVDTVGGVDCIIAGDREDVCTNREIQIPGAQANWRLPTRGDFLQADINGARFVLPGNDRQYWTATVDGTDRNQAWTILPATGILASARRDTQQAVRCVGRILPQ